MLQIITKKNALRRSILKFMSGCSLTSITKAQQIDTSSGSGYDGSPRTLYKDDATYANPSQ